ncbi:neuropeptide CCHamide-1 receptor-like [Contarinia nasturtii]|uniref:neuropeptide CCHamide-1 receptor-like n=1 Tax=Contarinia nasturtii TaxID=265458 RepID=UPI0012D3C38D|nr:neuropeptide CCHamide-1 receptor-like [Contarinia nasturtii]XP_031640625.1 neuropeptide CCHamide-1 receptor-like [Contarinia nasturtii]
MMVHSSTSEWSELRSVITQSLIELSDSINTVTDSWSTEFNNDTNATAATTPINTEEVSYKGYQYRPETYIVPIIFGIIFLAGLMGNGMLIAVIIKHRAMRNVPNTHILSLSIADLILILTAVPFVSVVYTVESWPWGDRMCILSEFMKDFSTGVSVFTLVAMSLDRFVAIVNPLRRFRGTGVSGKRTTLATFIIAAFIWMLAIICAIPALIGSNVKYAYVNKHTSFKYCYPFPEEWGPDYPKAVVLAKFLVYYAIPLVIIGLFYIMIAVHLAYGAGVPGEMQGAVRQVKARRKVAITVITFVVIFCICFFPQHAFMLWFYFNKNSHAEYNTFWHVLRIIGFCLSFGNSCANPIALYFVSAAFRKHFNRTFRFLLCKGPRKPVRNHMSLTSTISRRYPSKRYCQQTMLGSSRQLQETTITIFPNGNNNYGIDMDKPIPE